MPLIIWSRHRANVVLFFLLNLCPLFPLLAQEIPEVQFSGTNTALLDYALIRDPLRNFNRDQVVGLLEQRKFEIHHQDKLDNYGFTNDVLWLAFRVNNLSNQGSNTFVEVMENNLKDVRLHIMRNLSPDNHVWTQEFNGAAVPVKQRPIPVAALIFNAGLPPQTSALFIIRIDNFGPNRIHVALMNAAEIFADQENRNVMLLAYMGALVTLMLYNILLFAAMRDRNFIWFVLHLMFLAAYVYATSGFGFKYIWSFSVWFQSIAQPVFTLCILGSVLMFIRQYVETPILKGHFNQILMWHLLAAAILIPIFIFNYSLAIQAGGILLFLSLLTIMVIGFLPYFRRDATNRIIALSIFFLLAGALLSQVCSFGTFISGWPLVLLGRADYAGIIMEAFILSFALSRQLQDLRRQKEEAESKNRMKQSFIANVSHEMRTPLNAIIGFAEAIQDMGDPEMMRRFNRRILSESERLLFQINQVLDLAKIEANHLAIDVAPFNLLDSLEYIDSVFRNHAQAKGIAFLVEVHGACPPRLTGDRLRIEQVMRNLVDNAIKFTEVGRVSVLANCTEMADGLVNVAISVQDTGIGIPMEKQAEIFEEFVQADSSITRRFGGTGLGTSISRKLVEAMGGVLKLQSTLNSGSTFSFDLVLPVGMASSSENKLVETLPTQTGIGVDADPVSASINTDTLNRPRILVVDDFETNRQVVCIHLSRLPVDVDSAANGPEALDLLYRRHYDLVLLDLFMPGLSGHDVVRIIRERWSANELPVLGLTASGAEEDIAGALASGMNGVMVKPVKRVDLIAQIQQYLPQF